MTRPRLKPCPQCGSSRVATWVYDSGWRRVECDACDYIATPAENLLQAARNHNARTLQPLTTPKGDDHG